MRILNKNSKDGSNGPCVRQNHIAMRNLRCAIQMMIRMTVFWTVCTPNHIEIRNLKCAIQMMVRTIIWIAHFKLRIVMWFGVHTVQNTVFRILIQDAHLESRFKIRTLPSCENSLTLGTFILLLKAAHPKLFVHFSSIYDHGTYVPSNIRVEHTTHLIIILILPQDVTVHTLRQCHMHYKLFPSLTFPGMIDQQ